MDSYTFALVLGAAGLVTMAATGFAHSGTHTGGQPGGHEAAGAGHAAGHVGVTQAGHAHASRAHVGSGPAHQSGVIRGTLLSLASPRTLFSLLIGFGLTGVVGRQLTGGVLLFVVALLGAAAFDRLLVQPLWRSLFRFASNPATTLEDSLMGEARAASGFDEKGQGLVAIEVDGQIVQCLGTLRPDDYALGVRVRAGDVLRVEDVDAARSRCTVSFVNRAANS